jgi:CheY-like chemotaxis protein
MLSRHFRYLGYEVDTALDGTAALDKLSKSSFQVVILDIVMPKMNGVDVLRTIKQQYPMIHVIMITGYVTLENALACMRLGADTCVFKPLEDLTELQQAITDAVKSLKLWQEKLKTLQAMSPKYVGEAYGK